MDRKVSEAPWPPLDARMQRTRTALAGTLLALLEEKPFDQMTVREITRKAGVGYATFFRHYTDKDALLNDLAAGQIRELLEITLPVLFTADSLTACNQVCGYVWERRKLWSALLTGGAAATVRNEFIRQAKLIPEAVARADTWISAELQVIYASGGTLDVLAWWLAQPQPEPVDRVAAILDRLVIAPTMAAR